MLPSARAEFRSWNAATLYIVLTLADGKADTSTYGFTSLQSCEESIEKLRALDHKDHRWGSPHYRCEEHKPYVGLDICERWYHGQCEFYRTSTRRGCEALRWVTYMRDRGHVGGARVSCYQDPPEKEPPLRSPCSNSAPFSTRPAE